MTDREFQELRHKAQKYAEMYKQMQELFDNTDQTLIDGKILDDMTRQSNHAAHMLAHSVAHIFGYECL